MYKANSLSEELLYQISAEAKDKLSSVLQYHDYSKGNNIIPIRDVRRRVVSHIAHEFTKKVIQTSGRRLKRRELWSIVEEAAHELGYERYNVAINPLYNPRQNLSPLRIDLINSSRGREYWVQKNYATQFNQKQKSLQI